MTQSVMFVDDEKRQSIRAWFDRFRARSGDACESVEVETSFGRTHALVAGPKDSAPFVVLHGALASSAHILPEVRRLSASRRVYALDVIGQSVMSEDRRIPLDGDDYGKWVGEATTKLGLDRFDLMGVSWGGFVSMRAANVLGERVKRLVLIVPAGLVSGPAWAGFTQVGWPLMIYRSFPSEKRLERVVRSLFSTIDEEWTQYFGEAVRSYKLDIRIPPLARPESVRGIQCPVLVVAAEGDLSFPGEPLLARAKELLGDVEGELVAGSKHSPPMTDEFRTWLAARIERFFDTHAMAT